MWNDDDKPAQKKSYTLGQDVTPFAIDELESVITALEEDITRLKGIQAAKIAMQSAAQNLFRKPEP